MGTRYKKQHGPRRVAATSYAFPKSNDGRKPSGDARIELNSPTT
jgi:hypothetical protein